MCDGVWSGGDSPQCVYGDNLICDSLWGGGGE